MLKSLIFSILIFAFVPSALAQNQQNILSEAEFLIKAYSEFKGVGVHEQYLKYSLIQQVVGSIDLENRSITEFKFNQALEKFQPKNFPQADQAKIKQAREILGELAVFSRNLNKEKIQSYLKQLHQDGLAIKKPRNGILYHLPGEMARFTFAIVAVRMATCFGPSLATAMKSMSPDDIKASHKDPACIYEIAELLQSPIFYIGFSGFVLASQATSVPLMKMLDKIDPRRKVSKALLAGTIPQLAMAVGFFTDHMIQTIAHNKDLTGCAKNLGLGAVQSLNFTGNNHKIGEDQNGDSYYGFYDQFESPTCQRAGRYLSSTQFLAEDMGAGLAGLLATSAALTGVQIALSSIKKISFVFTLTGVGGFVVGTARMVVFLGLYEVIGPIVKAKYFEWSVRPKVEAYQMNVQTALRRFKPDKATIHRDEKCSHHYSGFLDEGIELCSRVPILAELYSFRDYSQTWRNKKILGKFYENFAHWKKKLTSFFNHYMSAKQHVEILSRSREIRLTGKSEYFKNLEERIKSDSIEYIGEHFPQHGHPEEMFNHIEKLHDTFLYAEDNETAQAAKAEADSNPHVRYIFDRIHIYKNNQDLLQSTIHGLPFYGLGYGLSEELFPSEELVEEVRLTAVRFLKSGVSARFATNGARYYEQIQQLHDLGIPPEEIAQRYPTQTLIRLISSDQKDDIALGLLLLNEWFPVLFGKEDIQNLEQRGFNELQLNQYQFLKAQLETFLPYFSYDALYFDYTGKKSVLFDNKKSEDDAQWESRDFMVNTDNIYDLTLAELMCGHNPSFLSQIFGDRGTALEFEYPHLSPTDHCQFYYFPIHYEGELLPAPSRTVFTTDEGLRVGLHQIYIQAEENSDSPYIFNSEQEATEWWNSHYFQPSLEKLKVYNQEYDLFVNEDLIPLFDTSGLSSFWQWVNFLNPFKNPLKVHLSDVAATDKASESLYYELSQYLEIISHIAKEEKNTQWASHFENFKQCYVKMLSAVSSKNYTDTKSQCIKLRNQIKDRYWYKDQTRSDHEVSSLLDKNEDDLSADEINDLILIHAYKHVEKIFAETDMYHEIINEKFKFNLEL